MAKFEVYDKNRKIATFESSADPNDANECVRLLRQQAKKLRIEREHASLRAWTGKNNFPKKYVLD